MEDNNRLLIIAIGSVLAGATWLGQMLKDLTDENPIKPLRTLGGLMTAMLAGFVTGVSVAEFTRMSPQLIWMFCIFSGLIGEKTFYIIANIYSNAPGTSDILDRYRRETEEELQEDNDDDDDDDDVIDFRDYRNGR